MSERGSCVSRYEPIPTIPEDGPLPPLPSLRPDSPPPPPPPDAPDPRLGLVDFWPRCLTPDNNLALATFERFDSLLPRANSWLRENSHMKLLKCETIERKIWALDQLEKQVSNTKVEVPYNVDVVLYVKGLRLWHTCTSSKSRKPAYAAQVGYRNSTPRCIRSAPKDCSYEELGPMYVTLNEDLIERPLEGPILTMETVPIRLDRLKWDGPDVEVDRTSWPMTPKQHIFFFSRIYYLFQCPAYEQVGAADFLPDFMNEPSQKSGMPKYTHLPFVMKKFNAWLKQVKDIKVTNIQSLEAAFPGKADRIKTNTNFIQKADTMPLIRFIRVTYTRPKFGLPPGGLHIPRLVTQKTFVPHILTSNDNESSPTMEDLKQASNRIRAWFKHVGNKIISMEEAYHPLPLILKRNDEGESTVLPGEWQPLMVETINRKQSMQPAPQLYLIRVYLEGQYLDPPETMVEQSISQMEGGVECCSLL